MSSDHELLRRWEAEEREQPTGWSFDDLSGRLAADPLPWDFRARFHLAAIHP